jgi:hypothetical protein
LQWSHLQSATKSSKNRSVQIPCFVYSARALARAFKTAYKGVRRYLNKPRSYKPRKPKTSSKRRSDLDYKKWERDMRKPPSSRVHLKRRRGFINVRYIKRVAWHSV